ncbi:uncharacterized protein RHOBADRAFT_54034 [Rhodotorula graminis WP1]|uniref:Actin-like ATPase domain-containing protein n=1 Tax=Rhodotorula graminis (strain WP1) TaxID=578459 RepID=A0A194S438_RHOGW|nr:uncharacterized protein RHOBADRAFT_54034 [Rhodotorula graminis WP1]KPV74181.1 hypothetical protein RHOBADRAFT_54034 [Rhodotorula graminis WP1]
MVARDELLLVFDLTSTLLRAGLGVLDLIRGPLIELPTRVGRMAGKSGTRVEDYLVGAQLAAAEAVTAAGGARDFDIIDPCRVDDRTGFEVTDWNALEAVFRYAMHTSLQLQRPPLAHPVVLSLPSSCPPSTVDGLHRLLFERLLLPQLLVGTRPFFASGAAGALSCVVLDLGYRGEGSEISVVHDNQELPGPSGLRLAHLDEGVCDDYCALKLLEAHPDIPHQLATAAGRPSGADLAPGELAHALRRIVGELKVRDLIGLESPLVAGLGASASVGAIGGGGVAGVDGLEGEDGSFDVAKAIVEGKVNDIVKGGTKGKGKDNGSTSDAEGDFVVVANPFAPAQAAAAAPAPAAANGETDLTAPVAPAPGTTLRLGPARHRYLEPLFRPSLIAQLAPSASPAAAQLGLGEYERFAHRADGVDASVAEAIGVALSAVEDAEVRAAVGEAIVVISSGRIASNRALGPALIPLLSPFRSDLAAGYDAEGQPLTRPMRYLRAPEYFANFKERAGEWMVYLGACVMGKLLIGDSQSKLFMTKQDYANFGPSFYRQLDPIQAQ